VLEGAGSPVEVNLQSRDLTNLRLAQFLRARCILVADIERGGVFAQLVGTLALLRPVERPLIRGLLINRFRGRRELFDEGRRWLEAHTGIPVLGVMPWLDELFPPEDSLDLLERRGRKSGAELEIAVLRLPSLSNFSDLDPLEAEPSVQLRWLTPGEPLGRPDAVIVPGSKQTLRDLAALQRAGLGQELRSYVAGGGQVFGICGGLQLLGRELLDPQGLEGGDCAAGQVVAGLDLLPLRTHFGGRKALRQRQSTARWPGEGLSLEGFELHRGLSSPIETAGPLQPLATDPDLGHWYSFGEAGGLVAGTYLHGVFESGPWRRRWLNQLRQRRGLAALPENPPHHSRQRDALLERLADAFEAHVNLTPLLSP
jgi:adenosylcobyric acid synthase